MVIFWVVIFTIADVPGDLCSFRQYQSAVRENEKINSCGEKKGVGYSRSSFSDPIRLRLVFARIDINY